MEFIKVIIGILIPNSIAFINGKLTRNNLSPWYDSLRKPNCNPPKWLFAPVWITLYTAMGFASYLIWRDGGNGFNDRTKLSFILYGIQLLLNWIWTPIFFVLHEIKWALYELLVLTFTATLCGYTFYQINSIAGLLFIPYICWLGFATFLNYKLYILNNVKNEIN